MLPFLTFFNDLMRLAYHDKRFTAMLQTEARYKIRLDPDCGWCLAKRTDPDIAVGVEAR